LVGWQRQFIDRLIEHGDLPKAALQAGCSKNVETIIDVDPTNDRSLKKAMNEMGLHPARLIAELKMCLDAKGVKFDRNGNPIPAIDLRLKKATLEMIFKLRGDFVETKEEKSTGPDHIEELFADG